jgi:hypothetical protein
LKGDNRAVFRVQRASASSRTSPAKRVGVLVALFAATVTFAGCVPEPVDPSGSPASSVAPGGATATSTPTDEASPSPSGSISSTVTPAEGEVLIVTAGITGSTLEVTAMIQGVSEVDGICTLEILDSDASHEAPATAGNGVTYCGLTSVTIPDDLVATGSFRILYSSPSTQAESAITSLESVR